MKEREKHKEKELQSEREGEGCRLAEGREGVALRGGYDCLLFLRAYFRAVREGVL